MTVQSVVTASAETGQRAPAAPDPLSAVMAIHRRNIEALLKAQQAVMEGNKALMEHQIECLRSTMEQTMTVAQGIMKEPDVKANFKKRCESIKASMQGGICNSNILSEVSARFNGKAAQIIQDRLYEAIDESEAVFETVFDSYPHQFIGWMTASKAKESDII